MKIAFISNYAPTDKIMRSGVPYSIFRQLSKRHEVVWVKPELKGIYKILRNVIAAPTFIDSLLGHTRNSRLIGLDWVYRHDIENKLKAVEADAVFALGTQWLSTLRTELPIFIRIDAIFHSFVNYYVFGLSKRGERTACHTEECELAKVNTVFAASQWVVDEAHRYIPSLADRFVFVETGANLDKEKVKPHEKHYGVDKPLRALFIGFDVKRKGIDIAIEAVRILNEDYGIKMKLVVIGGKPEQALLDSTYMDYVGLLNKNKPEQYEQMYDEFTKADIFLFPTRAECHGIVNCEAAAYALPIFSYDTGGVSSYVINDVNGYTLPLTATGRDFAEIIHRSIVNGNMEKFSKKSRQLFEERFNWDVWGEKVNRRMEEVVNNIKNDK